MNPNLRVTICAAAVEHGCPADDVTGEGAASVVERAMVDVVVAIVDDSDQTK